MKVIVTNPGRSLEERPLEAAVPKGQAAVITDKTDQEMLGFGGAFTEASCVCFSRLKPAQRKALLEELFSPAGGNFSVGRLCVGSSDYAETPYCFAPVPGDMEMKHFDASHDDICIIPVIRQAREINPALFLYGSPWSPPGWMKTSGILQGGWMRRMYIKAYALYYLKFLQHYRNAGIVINGLTPQNESETDQVGRMPACLWHPELEMEFAVEMRRLLDENGFRDLKIWLMDHNFIMWRRACFQMDDPEVRKAAAGIAWHPYEGHPEMIEWFRNLHPECENHWTEGNIVPIDLAAAGGKTFNMGETAAGFIRGINSGCQSITIWNLALDPQGYPNIGPFNCRGIVEIERDGSGWTYSADYHVLVQFSKFIKRGARRLKTESPGMTRNFELAAFQNPGGERVVLIANTETHDSDLALHDRGKTIPLRILRESVSTVLL
jgi:glucosylceramidase